MAGTLHTVLTIRHGLEEGEGGGLVPAKAWYQILVCFALLTLTRNQFADIHFPVELFQASRRM